MKPRLLAIPSDKLEDYNKKGYSKQERHDYFNPNGGFEVFLLGIEESVKEPFEFVGFTVYPSDRNLRGIERIMEKVKPEIVRGYNGTWGAKLSGEIGKKYNIPSITSVHNTCPGPEVKEVDKVICVSEIVKQKCIEQGVFEKNLMVINDYVDLDVFRDYGDNGKVEKLRRTYQGEYRIISAGRLEPKKNLERLIEASKIVHYKLPELIHLHIGKFGKLRQQITKKIRDLKADHILLLDNVTQKQLAYFYSWADAFTMASVSEGFGLVYIEALACKTPVITSNLPPMTEYVKDNYNGLLVNPYSPKDIAKKIIGILTNKRLYEKIKSHTRESVERFNIGKIKKKEATLYKEMLK